MGSSKLLAGKDRALDTENGHVDIRGEGEVEMNWEIRTDLMYTVGLPWWLRL